MNTIQLNNERHEKALEQVAEFVMSGGEIKYADDDYKGLTWEAPRPKRLVMPDNTGKKKSRI